MKFFDLMKEAANEVGLELTEVQYEQFIKYMRLLQEWNEKINLTAITEDEEVIKKHFIDCIKAFKSDAIKNARNIIDVGTGAGFPGLPIAIMNPNVEVTLLDSLNKRINYLNIVVRELGLKNVTTIHSRAEDGARKQELREKFDETQIHHYQKDDLLTLTSDLKNELMSDDIVLLKASHGIHLENVVSELI